MESPAAASEMARLMVLQAVVGDVQVLLLLPLTPFTYQPVLATADGTRNRASSRASSGVVEGRLCVMDCLLFGKLLLRKVSIAELIGRRPTLESTMSFTVALLPC